MELAGIGWVGARNYILQRKVPAVGPSQGRGAGGGSEPKGVTHPLAHHWGKALHRVTQTGALGIAKGEAMNNSAGQQHKPGQSQRDDRSIPRGNKPNRRVQSLSFLALPHMIMQPKHKPLLITAGKTVSLRGG